MNQELPFGQLVRERRRALDLTQDELARRVGCAPVTVRKIEYGDMRPSAQVAERLAMALAVPLEERPAFVRQARAVRRGERRTESPPTSVRGASLDLADLSGREIRGYQLGPQLGRGGFGIVYRALQPGIEREVAIKAILPQYADQPDFVRRFEAEAQLVARLEHPHIVPLYDYWREPGVAFLVMRYLRGGSLSTLLQQGPPTLEHTRRMVEQLSTALSVAHRAGVVHRDLKPANIMLDEEGNAYLADFGIAKDLRRPNELSFAGAFVGSPAYSSPEQLRAEAVSPQTDIYALGVLLFELLTGQKPFRGPTPALLAQQHLNEPVPSLVSRRSGLTPALDQIVQRAMAKVATARYSDVRELAAAVAMAIAPEPVAAALPVSPARSAPLTEVLELSDADNPYVGLRPFDAGDAARFFGRESLIQQLLVRLGESGELGRFLAVIGPSGSGKSSVVRAGVTPALRAGALPGSEEWYTVTMVPGATPLTSLAEALIALAPAGMDAEGMHILLRGDERGLLRAARLVLPPEGAAELVLVIDQFEELFTLCPDEGVRQHLLDSIVTAVLDEGSRLRVIVMLRADLLDRPLQYVDFGELLRQRGELVLAMTPDELEQAILGPAQRAGLVFEAGLTTTLMGDVANQPGALPLLQHALSELFLRRQGRVLTRAAYAAIGGVSGALAGSAEATYVALAPDNQGRARQLFLRLVTPGEGNDDLRRRVRRSELAALGADDAANAFGRARLLTFDRDEQTREPTIEVAHEALLREWPRLRGWLEGAREELRIQRQLALAAEEWKRAGREPSFLASGARLAQFAALADGGSVELTSEERAFVAASLEAATSAEVAEKERQARELETQRTAARRLRYLVGALALFLAVALGLSAFAFQQRGAAEANFTRAEAQRLAAEANQLLAENGNAEVIGLLALRSLRLQYTPQGDRAIVGASRLPLPERVFSGHTSVVRDVEFLPDGQHAVSAGDDGTIRLWDLQTGQELQRYSSGQAGIDSLAVSREGTLVATGSSDLRVHLYDLVTDAWRYELQGHTSLVLDLAFAPDGKKLYTGSFDQTLREWDTVNGVALRHIDFDGSVEAVAVSPDGHLIAVGDSTARITLWDAESFTLVRTLEGHTDLIWNLTFSADGRLLASGSPDKTARIWDVATGAELQTLRGHTNFLSGVAFSPDGRFLLTGSQDRTARLWSVQSGEQLLLLNGHTNLIWDVAYAPDGRSVLTTGFDQQIKLWRLPQNPALPAFSGHTSSIRNVAYFPDGAAVASTSYDGTARTWNAGTGVETQQFVTNKLVLEGLALSPDGRSLLTGHSDGIARLWDAETGAEIRQYEGSSEGLTSVAFAPDGARLVTGSYDYTVRIYARDHVTPTHILKHDNNVFGVAFSPDGRTVLSGAFDRTARLWDVETGAQLKVLRVPPNSPADADPSGDGAASVAYAPDGRSIATGTWSGSIWLWDVTTGEAIRQLPGHTSFVWSVVYAADGSQLLSAGADGTVRLWDVASGVERRRFAGHIGSVYSAAFAPNGRTIVSGADDGRPLMWDVRIADTVADLCAHLQRDFTAEERAQYDIPDQSPTCVSTPDPVVINR